MLTVVNAVNLNDTVRQSVNDSDLEQAHFYAVKANLKAHAHDPVQYKREIKWTLKELQKQRKSLEKYSQKLIAHMNELETKMEKLLNG